MSSGESGVSTFAADPDKPASEQPVFWAPEALLTILQLRRMPQSSSEPLRDASGIRIDFSDADIRHAEDGWHVLLWISGIQHRLWLDETPDPDAGYAVILALNDRFPIASHAADLFWRSLIAPPLNTNPGDLTHQRRIRLTQSLQALDASHEGSTYRGIAEALFGAKHIPDHAWKTHDLRSRTIRLVQSGLALMRGGYRKLLRQPRDK